MTQVQGRSRVFLAMLVIVGLVILSRFTVVLDGKSLEVSDHAIERHGDDVNVALQAVTGCEPGCRYECQDGRTRYVNRFKQDGKWKWAVVVTESERVVTSFITESQNYIATTLSDNGCSNGFAHP